MLAGSVAGRSTTADGRSSACAEPAMHAASATKHITAMCRCPAPSCRQEDDGGICCTPISQVPGSTRQSAASLHSELPDRNVVAAAERFVVAKPGELLPIRSRELVDVVDLGLGTAGLGLLLLELHQ